MRKPVSCGELLEMTRSYPGSYYVKISFAQAVSGGWLLMLTFDNTKSITNNIAGGTFTHIKAERVKRTNNKWWVWNTYGNRNMNKGKELELRIGHTGFTKNNIIGIDLYNKDKKIATWCNKA